ncbi:MAG: 50S ribosomal protein L3 [Chitinispirillaceae bacterium]|nr:50S ribosomal protein L3 [Chitinispirillaceae bacterium]
MRCLIGKKIGMTRIFDESGKLVAVTVVQTGHNVIHQVKTEEKDGYSAVQLGYEEISEKKVNKPTLGHFKKLGTPPTKVVKEVRCDASDGGSASGQRLGVDIFENVKFVDVTGTTKGRGHTGTIKRYNFERGRESHGNTNVRERGSTGANSYPARVFPGLKMSGHYGNERVTIKRLEVVTIDKEHGLVFLRGAVPGRNRGVVVIKANNEG